MTLPPSLRTANRSMLRVARPDERAVGLVLRLVARALEAAVLLHASGAPCSRAGRRGRTRRASAEAHEDDLRVAIDRDAVGRQAPGSCARRGRPGRRSPRPRGRPRPSRERRRRRPSRRGRARDRPQRVAARRKRCRCAHPPTRGSSLQRGRSRRHGEPDAGEEDGEPQQQARRRGEPQQPRRPSGGRPRRRARRPGGALPFAMSSPTRAIFDQ